MKIIYIAAVRKREMLAATNVKKERQWKNRVNRNTNISSIKRVNRKLKEVSRFRGCLHDTEATFAPE